MNIHIVYGFAIDNDETHWTVDCPKCKKELEYQGFFDSGIVNNCTCGAEFIIQRVYFDDESYIE